MRPPVGWYQQPRYSQQGPSARWVAEKDLSLWLVRAQEERARREAAMAAAEAERTAARVSQLGLPDAFLNIRMLIRICRRQGTCTAVNFHFSGGS